ncbi:unnamed protein product [Closterium sp. NIES-53]
MEQEWAFRWDEDALLLQMKDGITAGSDEDMEIIYIGSLKVEVDASEQDRVAATLLENFNCVPTFLPADLKARITKVTTLNQQSQLAYQSIYSINSPTDYTSTMETPMQTSEHPVWRCFIVPEGGTSDSTLAKKCKRCATPEDKEKIRCAMDDKRRDSDSRKKALQKTSDAFPPSSTTNTKSAGMGASGSNVAESSSMARKRQATQRTPMDTRPKPVDAADAQLAIATFFHVCRIAPNVAEHDAFKSMLKKANTDTTSKEVKDSWKDVGVCIACNGWTDSEGRPQLNFLAVDTIAFVFLFGVDCGTEKKGAEFIAGHLKTAMVGQKPSKARYYLDDTSEVIKMLRGLANAPSMPSSVPPPLTSSAAPHMLTPQHQPSHAATATLLGPQPGLYSLGATGGPASVVGAPGSMLGGMMGGVMGGAMMGGLPGGGVPGGGVMGGLGGALPPADTAHLNFGVDESEGL